MEWRTKFLSNPTYPIKISLKSYIINQNTQNSKILKECIFSVGFSAHAMIMGEGLTNHQLPALFKTFLSLDEISSHAQIPLFQAKGQYTGAQQDKTLQNWTILVTKDKSKLKGTNFSCRCKISC